MRSEPKDPKAALAALRADVDRINARLVSVLQQRARLVARIARLKRRANLPIVDVARERAMLRAALVGAGGGFSRPVLERILRAVFTASRALATRTATSRRAPARRA